MIIAAIVLIMLKLKMMMKILNHLDNFKNDFIVLKIIKGYKYHGQFYYLIKCIRSSIVIDNECFLGLNKYKIVGLGVKRSVPEIYIW